MQHEITPVELRFLAHRYQRKGEIAISDALAMAAECASRGEMFGKETWIDAAIARIVEDGHSIPPMLSTEPQAVAAGDVIELHVHGAA